MSILRSIGTVKIILADGTMRKREHILKINIAKSKGGSIHNGKSFF